MTSSGGSTTGGTTNNETTHPQRDHEDAADVVAAAGGNDGGTTRISVELQEEADSHHQQKSDGEATSGRIALHEEISRDGIETGRSENAEALTQDKQTDQDEVATGSGVVAVISKGKVSEGQQSEPSQDEQTLPVSQHVICAESGEDLSSVGMSSVVSSRKLEEPSVEVTPVFPLRSSRRSWNPSSPRARSRRWDLAEGRLPLARHTLPPVLQDHYNVNKRTHPVDAVVADIEAPISDDQSRSGERSKDLNSASIVEDSSDSPIDGNSSKASHPSAACSPYTTEGAPDSKYETYACVVDSTQGDRGVEIKLASFARPHMRAFHMAWMSFFVAFFTWFALTPLLSEIQRSLRLAKEEIWTSSICGVAGSAVTRVMIGPICDKFGARWSMGGTLALSGIPMGLTGLIRSGTGLNVLRLFIGLAGSAFVTCQYWTSSMFAREVSGTANALVAGWGNLGGGVTQLVMGSLLFPLLKVIYGGEGWTRAETPSEDETVVVNDRASDLAWRTACVFPALLCFVMTYFVIRITDDCPKGNYSKRNREGFMVSVSARKAVMAGIRNFNTWVLFIQYGCCFGVEITMVNAAALYFKQEFGLSTESAAAIASIFGWMNLFARGLGGFFSDITNAKWGMRGRLWVQVISLVAEGALVIVFSKTHTLAGAIITMIVFSCFVQAAEGSTYGIVPYVNPSVTGSISGIVGAGGNVGGVGFATIFRNHDYREAFSGMGWTAMISASLTVLISIQGHASLCCGSDAPEVQERRNNHTEELGSIPPVLMQDPDESRRSSVIRGGDPDASRRR